MNNDLNYIIHKTRIGLASTNLSSLCNLYTQIIDEKVIEIVAEDLEKLLDKNFVNAEEIRKKWENTHSQAFLNEVDKIIFNILNNDRDINSDNFIKNNWNKFYSWISKNLFGKDSKIDEIKIEYITAIKDFPIAAKNIYDIWSKEYSEPTILDDSLNILFSNPTNKELYDKLNYSINKANSSLLLANSVDKLVNEISIAKNQTDNLDIKHHIDKAKEYYHESIDLNSFLNLGYKDDSLLDEQISVLVNEKIHDLNIAVEQGKEIENLLLGANIETFEIY